MTYDVGNPTYQNEDKVIEAARRHVASFEPGTLYGSELALALALRDLDGDKWDEWCEPGEPELEDDRDDYEWLGFLGFFAAMTMLFSTTWPMSLTGAATAVACAALYLHHRKRT